MENKITPELIAKAKQAKSAEEFIALAKEDGAELSAEEAQKLFDRIGDVTLTDDDLEKVSGGYPRPIPNNYTIDRDPSNRQKRKGVGSHENE